MMLDNQNIIFCVYNDLSVYWVHNLTQNKILVHSDETCKIFYVEKYNFYIFYHVTDDSNYQNIIETILNLLSNKNKVHAVISDFRSIKKIIEIFESEFPQSNFDYSYVNHMGELIYDYNPINIKDLKKIKNYFSCSNVLNQKDLTSDFEKNPCFHLDYMYSLIYFYFKLGFNFIEKGKHIIKNSKPTNDVFLYTRFGNRTKRKELIEMALNTNRIKGKEFNDTDFFWFERNNSLHSMSFLIDYSTSMFNLIMETQPLMNETEKISRFITEKTLKSFMVPTPSYVVLQEEPYEKLKEYGFYFLNSEFGFYDYNNYVRFCEFLKTTNENDFNKLHETSLKKSENNKIILEQYIFSDKIKEINLLWN